MIHKFSVSNFYSINEKISIDFTLDQNAPLDNTHVVNKSGTKVSLINMVVGANASGKTNLLKVLPFLQHLLYFGYTNDPDDKLYFRPFGDLKENRKKPTDIDVDFSIGERLFYYRVKMIRSQILEEELKERSRANVRVTSKVLFSRVWNEAEDSYDIKDVVFGIDKANIRKNSSVIATAYRNRDPLATLLSHYWRDGVFFNVFEAGYRGDQMSSRELLPKAAIEYFFKNPELMNKVRELLDKYDIGFGDFIENEFQEEKEYSIRHNFSKKSFNIPLDYESSGTKQLLVVLRYIISTLSSHGAIAVIDEIDANLHPIIVEELISLFSSTETNRNHSQIIFSSHSHLVMNNLSKYQVYITEKNSEGSTEAYRLNEVKGLRSVENYAMRYVTGAYGGVPNID